VNVLSLFFISHSSLFEECSLIFQYIFRWGHPNQLEKDKGTDLDDKHEVFVFCIFMVGLKDVAEDSTKSFGPLDSNQLGMLICA